MYLPRMVKDDTLHDSRSRLLGLANLLRLNKWANVMSLQKFPEAKVWVWYPFGNISWGKKTSCTVDEEFAMQIKFESQGSLAFLVGGAMALGNSLQRSFYRPWRGLKGICSIWRNSPKISPLLTNKLKSVFHDSIALLAMLLTRYT